MACSIEIVTRDVGKQERTFDEYWTQRWTLSDWDKAENELQESGFFAIEEGYTSSYVFYDDKNCTLQQNGIWLYGEYERGDPHPLRFHIKTLKKWPYCCVRSDSVDSIPQDSFGWEKETFRNSFQAYEHLPVVVQKLVKYKDLARGSMFSFRRQPLFYLGIRTIKVYVDTMKVGQQFYNVGTFHRFGRSPFRIPQCKFLTPARNKIFQMVWENNPDLYKHLQDDKGFIPSISFESHLSQKPFSPKIINKIPDSEHRNMLKHLATLFPRSFEEQKKLAEKSRTPLVAHLYSVALHTQPQNVVVEADEKSTFI